MPLHCFNPLSPRIGSCDAAQSVTSAHYSLGTAQVSPTEVYLVVNAGCREKDLAHIGKHLEKFQVRASAYMQALARI